MSRYEWERGSFKLPAKEYPKVRDAVIAAYNREQDRLYTLANRTYDAIKAATKGKRGINKRQLLDDFQAEIIAKEKNISLTGLRFFYRLDEEAVWAIQDSLFLLSTHDTPSKILKPKKKDFAKANKSTHNFYVGEASITFDPKNKTLSWSVEENNHACERAREHPVAVAFFRALRRVTWTNRSGGTIYGNDEYNRLDDGYDRAGGGGSYIKDQFGGLGERANSSVF